MKIPILAFITVITSGTAICQTAAEPKPVTPPQAISIFNGKDLTGWKVVNDSHTGRWSVANNALTSGDLVTRIPSNSYLATTKEYGDFEFRFLFRIQGDPKSGLINSGIQYRSIINGAAITGYQADIGTGYWGDIYDERRRGKLVDGDLSTLKHILKETGWNSYIIRCKGNVHELYINGVKTVHYVEKDPKIPSKGHFALQIHSGGSVKVEFSNITITEL